MFVNNISYCSIFWLEGYIIASLLYAHHVKLSQHVTNTEIWIWRDLHVLNKLYYYTLWYVEILILSIRHGAFTKLEESAILGSQNSQDYKIIFSPEISGIPGEKKFQKFGFSIVIRQTFVHIFLLHYFPPFLYHYKFLCTYVVRLFVQLYNY